MSKLAKTRSSDPVGLLDEGKSLVLLFVSLIFLLLVVPVFESFSYAIAMLQAGLTAVLITAAVATKRRRALLWSGLVAAAIAGPLGWLAAYYSDPLFFAISCALDGFFLAAMAIVILNAVVQKHLATFPSLLGAIGGYLLLGIAWAFLYWGLDLLDASSLDFEARLTTAPMVGSSLEVTVFSQVIYFSFVTMSTLGYGDITPQTPISQTLTWMQSVTGQFYLAVLVAWLVSELPRRRAAD